MESETIECLRSKLKESENQNNKLTNELTKLKRYNKDLISQIDLTNSKLHLLLGVCKGRDEKSIQTDLVGESGKCSNCLEMIKSTCSCTTINEDNKQLKAADWAQIAQQVVDSNDYILEPTSQTYYSQSTGWYYYPKEKLFLDPKSKSYYTYNQNTKNYEPYLVEPVDGKKELIVKESEEGELLSSGSESSDKQSDIEIEYENVNNKRRRRKKLKPEQRRESDEFDSLPDDESNISCLRLIVRESESLKLGSLLLITITGALIGNSPTCDLTITDISVSRKHARISYDTRKRCYQIVDCSSKHGVFLNGRRLESEKMEKINHGDILKLGKSEFLLHHHYGKEVTCSSCEPGCVQAELLSAGKLVEEKDDPLIVEDRHTALKRLKKLYGVTWTEDNRVSLGPNYNDRARKRRVEKGSDNPYQKAAEGTSLDKPLNQKNKGFKMLEKLGWSKGQGIGKEMAGDTEPLPLISTTGRTGLGFGQS
ncbi:angiogenic factor with G patch and FHA domains 1-like [Panonychus citri]|uniref:angiogenic factor with G patch and FHA domains 1-like n=1 Tax=Panonychus citri TaxID=50023 RepID=UPI0023081C4D|nr:angiogenic factor with G patch and FHA domains 1-like [Panonychus citri]